MFDNKKVVAFAGGVGGAKLADGLAKILDPEKLTVVVNTGDDLELYGLHISPDLDTVCYTLAGLANPATGWGQVDETWEVFQTLNKLDAPSWFKLGDHDLALHMERTRLLGEGKSLTDVTLSICHRFGVNHLVLPMSDQPVRTIVSTGDGRRLGFQEYFVKEQCRPEVTGFEFMGITFAKPSAKVLDVVNGSDLIVFCPSNPWVSIDPILGLQGMHEILMNKKLVAVTPIIGGKTIRGPAAKMFSELGIKPSALAVAEHYRDVLSGFVMDSVDQMDAVQLSAWGIMPLVTNTIMRSQVDRIQLARETLEFGMSLPDKGK
jgi:LPPG:FO 2-phospho-L-lactate transferase